jgi:SNF family Na+-dependent transporter
MFVQVLIARPEAVRGRKKNKSMGTTILVWVLPIVLVGLECIFMRRCINVAPGKTGAKKPPRAMLLLWPLSFVPVLGWVVFVALALVASFNLTVKDWAITSNRFTRYWFGLDD